MKTALLKRLRDDAYKEYGIKSKYALPDIDVADPKKLDGVYIIGLRNIPDKDIVEFSLKNAKKRLMLMRINYCISRVKEKRIVNNRMRLFKF